MKCPTCGGLVMQTYFMNFRKNLQPQRKCMLCGRDPDITVKIGTKEKGAKEAVLPIGKIDEDLKKYINKYCNQIFE